MHCHVRKGRFGKTEQHMERKLLDYINEIWDTAEGQRVDITRFTKKKNGILDTEMIKAAAQKMVELDTEIKGKKCREFYTAFLYCSLVIVSIDFTYFPDDEEEVKSGVLFSWNNSRGKGRNMQSVGSRFVFSDISFLNYLLSGKWLSFDADPGVDPWFSSEEENEYNEDIVESLEGLSPEELMPYDDIDPDDVMTMEEAVEANRAEADRIRAFYPGWRDFTKNCTKLHELFDTNFNEETFEYDVEKMTSEFLLAEGMSIYSDERKYLDVMVLLNRASKLLSKYMGEIGR